jgi:hypothetical protein
VLYRRVSIASASRDTLNLGGGGRGESESNMIDKTRQKDTPAHRDSPPGFSSFGGAAGTGTAVVLVVAAVVVVVMVLVAAGVCNTAAWVACLAA